MTDPSQGLYIYRTTQKNAHANTHETKGILNMISFFEWSKALSCLDRASSVTGNSERRMLAIPYPETRTFQLM